MRCTNSRKNISLALDGMLPGEETLALEEHLSACTDCRTYRDELLLGSRLLRATESEPSDAFEWTLQLKLNKALQEAAATRTPWEEPAAPRFGWLRGFTLSAAAGLAAAVAMALWLFPQGPALVNDDAPAARPAATVAGIVPDGTDQAATGVGESAGDADRRSLSSGFQPRSGFRSGLGGSLVSSGGVFGNQSDAGVGPWSRAVNGRNLGTLQAEIDWLRNRLRTSQSANDSLRALLADQPVGYLEGEDAPSR